MSEERKLILEMVAQGKITPDDAEQLLQALDESERTARASASAAAGGGGEPGRTETVDLGAAINRSLSEGLKALEEGLREMEAKLNGPAGQRAFVKAEEQMRRSVEKALEKARQADERTRRMAERADERARRYSDRLQQHKERLADAALRLGEREANGAHIVKFGVAIDRVSITRQRAFTLPAQPGDRFHLENHSGDVRIAYYDGDQIEVSCIGQHWGEDEADAAERADAFQIDMIRNGPDVVVTTARPTITVTGFVFVKESKLDYAIRVPHGTHLDIRNKKGHVALVAPRDLGQVSLANKTGDVEIKVAPEASFTYDIAAQNGTVAMTVAGDQAVQAGEAHRIGRVGSGEGGRLEVSVKTGEIRIIN